MPPKKRNWKPMDLQDILAWKPTHRRTPARRCHNLLPDEERREAQATPPPSAPRSQDSRMTKLSATKNAEETTPKNMPTPFADTATSFADKAKTEIPASSKLLPATKTEIPPKANTNVGLPTLTKIPKIIIRSRPGWPEQLQHYKNKIGYTIDTRSTRGCFLAFSPVTEWEYTTLWNLLIEDASEIVEPPSMRPIKKSLYKILPTPTSPLMPPTPAQQPQKTAPREAPPTRTPTPLPSANASRDGSPMPIDQPTDAIRTSTPSMSANELCDDSPTNTRSPTPSRSLFEPSPTRMPTRSPTPEASLIEDLCDVMPTGTRSPIPFDYRGTARLYHVNCCAFRSACRRNALVGKTEADLTADAQHDFTMLTVVLVSPSGRHVDGTR
ncbi:hypothetical protein ACJJTC_011792 [Scirpophaga incertulas]